MLGKYQNVLRRTLVELDPNAPVVADDEETPAKKRA